MKSLMFTVTSFILLSSAAAAGSSTKLVDVSEAVTRSLESFVVDNNQVNIDLFKGIKAASKASGVSVKIYLNNGESQEYACHRHDVSDPFECHQSN